MKDAVKNQTLQIPMKKGKGSAYRIVGLFFQYIRCDSLSALNG